MIAVHERLEQELILLVPGGEVIASRHRRWASATFTGARHFVTVRLEGDFPVDIVRRLEAHEFTVPGHIVADICLIEHRSDASGWELEFEALTVEAV